VGNETGSPLNGNRDSRADASSVGQTGNVSRSTSMGGAAKVFREFKWGLLTLFLLMVVVIGLVYDGGSKKKKGSDTPKIAEREQPEINLDEAPTNLPPPTFQPPAVNDVANTLPTGPAVVMRDAGPTIPANEPPDRRVVTTPPAVPTDVAPRVTVVPEKAPPEKTYVVKPGDTLTKIATNMLPGKGGLKAILAANKDVLPDPHRLKVGMTLKIPNGVPAPAEPRAAGKPDVLVPNDAKNEYVVQSGDTLERIARKLFNDGRKWREIYEWNREQLSDPGRLREGQVLKIKALASSPRAGAARAEVVEEPKEPTRMAETVTLPEPAEEPQIEVMNASSAQFP
jgi:LysM repeat protein